MADDSTAEKPSGISKWVQSHQKQIVIAGILFIVVLIWLIARHSKSSSSSGTTTAAANSAIPTTSQPYYGGGEYGGGYATSNNYGQLEQQLSSINTTLNSLASGNHGTSTTPTSPASSSSPGSLKGGGGNLRPPGPIYHGPSLNGMTVTQAENLLSQQGGQFYISNISKGGTNYNPGAAPSGTISSYTPYPGGTIRVGLQAAQGPGLNVARNSSLP